MSTIKIKYSEKLNLIRPFTELGIKNSKSFTPQQKALITKYYNILKAENVLKEKDGKVFSTVKFVRTKNKKGKLAPKITGVFYKGAKPEDKVDKKGNIIKESYTKIFIEADFSEGVIEDEVNEEIIEQILFEVLTPYYKELKSSDYFSIVVDNGFEIGRGRFRGKNADKKELGYTKGLDKKRKISELVYEIVKLLSRSVQKYKIAENLISGLYLWKFHNQKQPNKKQKKIIARKK